MFHLLTTMEFDEWLQSLAPKPRVMVKARLDLMALGHFGDFKRFDGLMELRWRNGLRVYAFRWKDSILVVLTGGNKNGQDKDIKKAKKIRSQILAGLRAVRQQGT